MVEALNLPPQHRAIGVKVKSVYVVILGTALAAWMAAGRWLFGIGGSLTWWYVPCIGLTYAVLSWWIARRITLTRSRGLRVGRAPWVALILSWVCAICFGFTVPDNVNGELESILSHFAGSDFSVGMSIALCNPFGIIAFSLAFIALGYAIASGRPPHPEEDELPGGQGMIHHPLADR